jgi:hypothetical protein
MTPTRWLITGFWIVILVLGVKAFYDFNSKVSATPAVPEQHWFPPGMPGSEPAAKPNVADVRLIHYVPHVAPGAMSFTADVVVQNFGMKKATGIQVRVQPYVGNTENSKTAPGPDEIPNLSGGDPMVNVFQWVDFPDLAPGATSTQTITLSRRSDADPAQSFKPQVVFQTVP